MTGLLPHRTTLQSMPTKKSKPTDDSAATVGCEAQLWQMAESDALFASLQHRAFRGEL
jgi:hypothetical protein